MCGIVGIASRNEFPSVLLLDRLKRLEYRGYDSYGYYDGRPPEEIASGNIEFRGRRPGAIGIAHTRWATHGGVTVRERPSPRLLRRPSRHRPQRHHREFRGPQEDARPAGASLRERDRFGGHRPLLRGRPEIKKPMKAVIADFLKTFTGTFAVLIMIRGSDEIYAVEARFAARPGRGRGQTYRRLGHLRLFGPDHRAVFFENDEFAVIRADGLSVLRPARPGRPQAAPEIRLASGIGFPRRPSSTTCSKRSWRSRRRSTGCSSRWTTTRSRPSTSSSSSSAGSRKIIFAVLRHVLPRFAPGRLFPPPGRGSRARP